MLPNTQGTQARPAHEDVLLALLPPAIRNYVLYHSPFDVCLTQIHAALGNGVHPAKVLERMRGGVRVETLRTYGSGHPNLPRSH